MSIILCIETSTILCSVALSRNGKVIAIREISEGYVHAEKLLDFVSQVLIETGVDRNDLNAVAVSSGPGSYTGLRIGVSAAKGLCYALGIPLIAISSLKALAWGLRASQSNDNAADDVTRLYCPMIDARRMEVFTAIYDSKLKTLMPVNALVMDENSFNEYFLKGRVYFTGDGTEKCRDLYSGNEHADFTYAGIATASSLAELAFQEYTNSNFQDIALFEPFYLKDYKAGRKNIDS